MKEKHGKAKGVACPLCDCRDSHVITVKNLSMTIIRNRECNGCSHRWRTSETAINCTGTQDVPNFRGQPHP